MICFKPQNSEENPLILLNNTMASQFARPRPLPFDMSQQPQPQQPQPHQLPPKPKLFSQQIMFNEEEEMLNQLRQNEMLQSRTFSNFSQPVSNPDSSIHYGQHFSYPVNNYFRPPNNLDSKIFILKIKNNFLNN
jgi:hypothetical protein